MKKTLLALLLVLLMVAAPITCLAADASDFRTADALNELGLFLGTGKGYELDNGLTRAQGTTLLVRMIGMEETAENGEYEPRFADVPHWNWAFHSIGYAYENGITNGTGPTSFSPDKPMTDYMFLTLVLRALGYSDQGEKPMFTWDKPYALAKELKRMGISVYIDTCGFVSREALERVIPYTDRFLYDIKAMDPAVHKACTGQENAVILGNLRYLSQRGCDIEIRYPLIKGYNDGECEKIGGFLRDLPGIRKIKVLQYHRFASSRYEALEMQCTLPDTETTPEDVQTAVEILRGFGLNAVNGITDD